MNTFYDKVDKLFGLEYVWIKYAYIRTHSFAMLITVGVVKQSHRVVNRDVDIWIRVLIFGINSDNSIAR